MKFTFEDVYTPVVRYEIEADSLEEAWALANETSTSSDVEFLWTRMIEEEEL